MNRYTFNYTSEIDTSNEVADIHIYGVIGLNERMFGEGEGTDNRAFALVKFIKSLDKKVKKLNVHLNSPGGIIQDGLAIYNTLKNINAEVHTHNSGLVASMASIIMLSGTTHFPKASLFHLHNALTIAIGNQHDFQNEVNNLKKFDDTLKGIIKDKTGKDQEIDEFFDGKDHYFTSDEAYELGVVDIYEENKKGKTPQPAQNIKNMTAQQLFELYAEEEKQHPAAWLQNLKDSLFPKQNITPKQPKSNYNQNTMSELKSAAQIIAAIGVQSLEMNQEGQVTLTVDQVMTIDNQLQETQNQLTQEQEARTSAENQVQELQQQVQNLQEKLDKKPSEPPQDPKGEDPQEDDRGIVQVDRETRKAMLEDE